MKSPVSVAVVGLGALGCAVALVLRRAGHPVQVWNRSAGKDAAVLAAGAHAAPELCQIAGQCDLIFLVVNTYEVACELLAEAGAKGLLAGRVLVPLCSGTPAQARAFEQLCSSSGAACLDGMPMCYPDGLGTSDGLTVFGGDANAFHAMEPILDALGPIRFAGTDPGTVNALAAGLGVFNRGALASFFEAARVVQAHGMELDLFLATLRHGFRNNLDAVLERTVHAAGQVSPAGPARYGSLAAHSEAAASDAKTAAACGLALPLMKQTGLFLDDLLRLGDAQADIEHAYQPWMTATADLSRCQN